MLNTGQELEIALRRFPPPCHFTASIGFGISVPKDREYVRKGNSGISVSCCVTMAVEFSTRGKFNHHCGYTLSIGRIFPTAAA